MNLGRTRAPLSNPEKDSAAEWLVLHLSTQRPAITAELRDTSLGIVRRGEIIHPTSI